jgi:very-short-patch-repair endonuclease
MVQAPDTIIARKLRKQQTPQEVKVWARLRDRQFLGYKFRRQVPVGRYVVDFYCAEKKLILEVDGGHHMQQETQDRSREEYLHTQGYQVLRFWNSDIEQNLEGVFERIQQALQDPPHLQLLSREGRGGA